MTRAWLSSLLSEALLPRDAQRGLVLRPQRIERVRVRLAHRGDRLRVLLLLGAQR